MAQYTTPQLVEAEIRASESFDTDTVPSITQVTDWISEESADIERFSGMVFEETQYTTDIDYKGQDAIYLKHAPVISIDSLTYATSGIGTDDYEDSFIEKTENKDFVCDNNKGKISPIFTNWSPREGMKRIKIVYTAGFDQPPLTIQKLATKKTALRILRSLIESNVNTGNDGGSISVGSISIVEPDGISVSTIKSIQNSIDQYEDEILKQGTGVYRYEVY